MAFVKYSASSPYAITPQTSWFIGQYKHRNIPSHTEDRDFEITAKYNLRPDLASYELYKDPSYWWIFGVRNPNDIRDPIWDFTTGKTIIIPSMNYLRSVIG